MRRCYRAFAVDRVEDGWETKALPLFRATQRLQINPQLLALLIKVAALQTQRAGHIGHVKIVAANFHQQHFLLKCFGPLGKRSRRSRLSISSWRRGGAARARQNHPDVRAAHRAFSRQEYEALHYIAEFAHISRPTVAPQL